MAKLKLLKWIGRSRQAVRAFPVEVRRDIGYALHFAQMGTKHPSAKPMKGFGGAGVLEISEGFRGDTYRAIYTLKFDEAVYVLHAFQKKSKSGIGTPQKELETLSRRLRLAEQEHARSSRNRSNPE